MTRACKSCRYWNRAKRATWHDVTSSGGSILLEHAQCRRYAPARLMADRGAVPDKVWPHVNSNDWCGEWCSAEDEHMTRAARTNQDADRKNSGEG